MQGHLFTIIVNKVFLYTIACSQSWSSRFQGRKDNGPQFLLATVFNEHTNVRLSRREAGRCLAQDQGRRSVSDRSSCGRSSAANAPGEAGNPTRWACQERG